MNAIVQIIEKAYPYIAFVAPLAVCLAAICRLDHLSLQKNKFSWGFVYLGLSGLAAFSALETMFVATLNVREFLMYCFCLLYLWITRYAWHDGAPTAALK